jgi:hypothetical protein
MICVQKYAKNTPPTVISKLLKNNEIISAPLKTSKPTVLSKSLKSLRRRFSPLHPLYPYTPAHVCALASTLFLMLHKASVWLSFSPVNSQHRLILRSKSNG